MTSPSLTPVIAVPSAPIGSLAELRSRHSCLLQRQRAVNAAERVSSGEMLGFLEAASALGRTLEDLESRESAQGIMDYWTATLLSMAPQASESSRPFSLQEYDPAAGEGIRSEAQQALVRAMEAAKKGDALADSIPPPQRDSLRRLLLRLVRLKENSLEAYMVPLPATDEAVGDPSVARLLRELEAAGLVQLRGGEEVGETKAWVLTHDSLLTEWSYLQGVISRRKGFREMVRGWDRAGRQPAALLSAGPQLENARAYRDCNEAEQDFIEASRSQGDRRRKWLLSAAGIGLTVLLLLAGGLLFAVVKLRAKVEELKVETQKAREAHLAVLLERNRADDFFQAAQRNTTIAEVAGGKASRYSEELDNLSDVLATRTDLPLQAQRILTDKTRIRSGPKADPMWGVQAELFVAEDLPGASTKAQKYVQVLLDARITMPVPAPQPRKRVASPTEVRCFYVEDRPVADRVVEILKGKGFPGTIVPVFVDDATAPRRFIQISVSREALK